MPGVATATEIANIRSFILAAVLSCAASAAAWGQAGCDDMQQLHIDKLWEKANAAFDAGKTEADDAYRQAFQAASAAYAEALASAEAAYDGSLYWVFASAEQLDHSAIAGPIAGAPAKRAHDANQAHRKWASSLSGVISRRSASMEEAETRGSVIIGADVPIVEEQHSDRR